MYRKAGLVLILLTVFGVLDSIGQDIDENVLRITGASDMESLGTEVAERFARMRERPVEINRLSHFRLQESGLFTPYQAASLIAYINENGDILSFEELALVDGFGKSLAEAMRSFISLYSAKRPGQGRGDNVFWDNSLMLRTSFKERGWNYGTKYNLEAAGLAEAGLMAKKDGFNKGLRPSLYGGHLTFHGEKILGTVIIGDYNSRFGQGLALWSGFSMSGLQSLKAFAKIPAGISPSLSFSSSNCRGAAASVNFGKLSFTAITTFPGLRELMEKGKKGKIAVVPALNITWSGRSGQVGLTVVERFERGLLSSSKLAGDTRFCINGIDLFSEASFDFSRKNLAFVAGTIFKIKEIVTVAAAGRYYPENHDTFMTGALRSSAKSCDEAGLSLGAGIKDFELLADGVRFISEDRRQLKLQLSYIWNISSSLSLKAKLLERLRDYAPGGKTALRLDLRWTGASWLSVFRAESVLGKGLGALAYSETGYKSDSWAVYFRGTLFCVDNWDDRIASYERDAPGNFYVPSYYGRGYSLCLYANSKLRLGKTILKAYARCGFTSFPWSLNSKKKPGKAELKFQVVYQW